MPDDLMREQNPFLARNYLHQILLNVLRIVVLRELQPARDAMKVRVHHHALGFAEPRAQDNIRRLARDPGQSQQLFHGFRNLAAELVNDSPRRPDH